MLVGAVQLNATEDTVRNLASADRLVREALADGGKLLVESDGGPTGEPHLCRPAVVADARPEMALCREAAFAPVLAVLPFDTLDEALRMDAGCPYGLGASVFTRNSVGAARLAAGLRTGAVTVNDVIVPLAHPATPFGGRGASGWGVTQGTEGLLEMTVPQAVSFKGGSFRPHYDLASGKGAADQTELLRTLLESTHAPTRGRRWRAWLRLLGGLWREMRAGIRKSRT